MSNKKSVPLDKISLSMEFFRMPDYYENTFWRLIANLVWVVLLMLAIAVLLIIGTLLNEHFLTLANMKTILSQMLTIGLVASMMVIIFSNGGLDLSAGSVMVLSGIIVAVLLKQGSHLANAILMGLSISLLIGLINGVLVGIARVPGVLVTFAMMSLIRGISYSVSGGSPVEFNVSNSLLLFVLKVIGWVLLILVGLIAAVLVQFPGFSRRIGVKIKLPEKVSSWFSRASFLGIPYVLLSFLAGFAGLMQISSPGADMATLDISFEIQVVFAVVLGGSCLGCRFGNVVGALFGTLFIATFQNILVLTGISSLHQQFTTGAVFLIATCCCYGYNGLVGILYHRQSQAGEL